MKKKKKTISPQVRISFSGEQFELISDAARAEGLNVTAFCRMAAVKFAKAAKKTSEPAVADSH